MIWAKGAFRHLRVYVHHTRHVLIPVQSVVLGVFSCNPLLTVTNNKNKGSRTRKRDTFKVSERLSNNVSDSFERQPADDQHQLKLAVASCLQVTSIKFILKRMAHEVLCKGELEI